ncbi:MAG TPA: histidine phosphatase family protein [Actinomycetota bacterium]|nr:histidine phosphatase family protein [Actinomycetota bacterium]
MTERILYLVRHGESDFDRSEFTMSARGDQWDPPLSGRGREQAFLLADRLASMIPPVAVYSSPLRRARETAKAFADRLSMEVGVEDDLAEAHLGEWEGKRFEEILRADELMLHRIRNQESIWRHAPGVEELGPLRARVSDAVERILASHPSGNVFIVCHGAVINAYVAPLLGVEHEMFFVPENTSLNSVVADGDVRRVRFLNDALHLSDPHLFADD